MSSSSSSGSVTPDKSPQKPEDFFFKKPRTLSKTCPVETTTQRLPLIEGNPRKKKEVKKITESSSYEENWLKPGISLPKLQKKKSPPPICSGRQDSGEPLAHVNVCSSAGIKPLQTICEGTSRDRLSTSLKCYKDVYEKAGAEEAEASSDVIGISACQKVFKVPSAELISDEAEVVEEKLEESHALKNWKRWLNEHKRQQNYLEERIGREKCKLQLHTAQNFRTMQEEKSLLVCARIPNPDKWRGNPFTWKPYATLRKHVNDENEDAPKYYGVKTKLEKGEISDIEFIGVPMSIKREKSLLCEGAEIPQTYSSGVYRQIQIHDFRGQIEKLKPHDVEMDELHVVGKKIPEEQPDKTPAPVGCENLPKIQVSHVQNEDSCSMYFYSDGSDTFWLSIGGEELQYGTGNENCQKIQKINFNLEWEINFGANPVGNVIERTLRIENKGTMSVEYKFLPQEPQQTQSLNSLRPKQHEPWFFFNKNSGILLPGQIYDMKFYHYTKRAGVRKETWELVTNPPLTKTNERGTIVLWAVSTDDSLDSGLGALDSYLKKQATRSVVGFIVEVLISKVLNPVENLEGIEYRSFFLEKELFEYHNPKHYYNSVIIKDLLQLFEQIPNKPQPEWDLSLVSLTDLIKVYVSGKERDSILRQIAENAKKLFRPQRLSVSNCRKYRTTYEILCKMVNFMEEDYDYFKSCVMEKKEEERKYRSEFGEFEEEYGEVSLKSEEKEEGGEFGPQIPEVVWEIKPINFIYFQTMFYLKVYRRVSDAIEEIAGALETSKLLEPWKKDYELSKPSRRDRE